MLLSVSSKHCAVVTFTVTVPVAVFPQLFLIVYLKLSVPTKPDFGVYVTVPLPLFEAVPLDGWVTAVTVSGGEPPSLSPVTTSITTGWFSVVLAVWLMAVGAVQAVAQNSLPKMVYVPAGVVLSGILSGVSAMTPPSTRLRARNLVSCWPTAGLPMALRGTMMLIVPSELKPLAGSAGVPAFKLGLVAFAPVATVKNTCPAALVFIRT